MSILNIVISFLSSIIVSVISFFIQRHFLKKDRYTEGVPTVHICTIQTPKALVQCRNNILDEFHELIFIEKSTEQQSKFKKVSFDEIEKMIYTNPVVFIWWELNSNFFLSKFVSSDDTFENIDYEVVPQIQSENKSFCFVCSENTKPFALLATYKRKSIIYEIRFISNGSIPPKFKGQKKKT